MLKLEKKNCIMLKFFRIEYEYGCTWNDDITFLYVDCLLVSSFTSEFWL
jgi:hypothetical protein